MSGTLSPDGKWLWNGTEWIPAPPTATPAAVESAQATIEQVAQSTNTPVQELTQIAHHYDLNQDNSLSEYELQLAASAYHTPPTNFSFEKGPVTSNGNRNKILASIAVAIVLLLSTTAWILSPEYSPLSSVHDEDGDGVADADDKFKFNPTQSKDADGDGYGDNQDPNATKIDTFPNNPTQWNDTDGDGWGDNDAEGATLVDNFTNNPTQWLDSDGDGYGDNQSDGATQVDNFTNNPTQWQDSDGDGYGDNQSTGATQVDDFINNPTQWRDSDGDGYGDNQASGATQIDAFVDNPTQWEDSDGDGYGDNQASGATQVDAFPDDPNEWNDLDGDGWGDNQDDCDSVFGTSYVDVIGCLDSDGDGYSNNGDSFPLDSSEWFDDDNDGVGNNADLLIDGDAYFIVGINFITADTQQAYDFGSSPDMRMFLIHDDECNGVDEMDLMYTSDTVLDSYFVDEDDELYAAFDIEEDLSSVCFGVGVQDIDDSDHDLLDYVDGTGQYYEFTLSLTGNIYDGIYTTYTYYNTNHEYKCIDIEFEAGVY